MCGGTVAVALQPRHGYGLSPRVRGNPAAHRWGGTAARSIPACAGEPPSYGRGLPPTRVYPRVCGGTRPVPGETHTVAGLSPRVRGNLFPAVRITVWRWSIPACAGEPAAIAGPRPCAEVYPRVCGGTTPAPSPPAFGGGLSPRVRGNRRPTTMGRLASGSIPACAGEPMSYAPENGDTAVYPACAGEPAAQSAPAAPRRVYPRVCGGTGNMASKQWPS